MNHESRIKKLEKELSSLKDLINSSGLFDEFVKLSIASPQLKTNPWVIRDRIKNDPTLVLGKHYQLNGSHYLVNVKEWRKLIVADAVVKKK